MAKPAGVTATREDQLSKAIEYINAKRYLEAARLLQLRLSSNPKDPDFLYPLATCQRYLGNLSGALDTLELLRTQRPQFPGVWLERGHVFRVQREFDAALAAYGKCVHLNPAYIGGWAGTIDVLLALRIDQGDSRFKEASRQFNYLRNLPGDLVVALRAFYDKQSYKSERLCRAFLKKHPMHTEGMMLLAKIGAQYGILDDAEFILQSVVEFDPNHRRARLDYIDILNKQQKYGQSMASASKLLADFPDDPICQLAYANQQLSIGSTEEALQTYKKTLTHWPDIPLSKESLYLTQGHALKAIGKTTEAINSYRRAYQLRKTFGDSYWSLANLKTYRFSASEISQLHELVVSPNASDEDKIHAYFALGKSFEDRSEFEASFQYYETGNRLQKERLNYDAARMTQRLQAHERICTQEFLEGWESGHHAPDPIFIVGLPRAGSTLLEQILASHSQVDGTLELHHISSIAQTLEGRRKRDDPHRYPSCLRSIKTIDRQRLGKKFIEDTRIHRHNAPFFIDKMPNNFRHIALISMILPNAKIIDARRHPMSCCFSGYKQLFASGQEFTYGQTEIGTYYRDYVRLMDHWDEVLPGKVLRVYYEDVVQDLEGQVRSILNYCGLPFEKSCLKFYETERSIRTPSSEQVRQPIYTSELEQWRNYERWLEPLKSSLGSVLTDYPHSR